MQFFLCYMIMINVAAFFLIGIDKKKAQLGAWRIPERTLFLSALLGGSVGAIAGMQLFRHKTRHRSFVIGMPAILIVQLLLAFSYFYFR